MTQQLSITKPRLHKVAGIGSQPLKKKIQNPGSEKSQDPGRQMSKNLGSQKSQKSDCDNEVEIGFSFHCYVTAHS